MRNVYLRVKIKSLAEEARIIRKEEMRAKKFGNEGLLNTLYWHRTYKVRKAARETLLAYQYLRDIPYELVEGSDSRPVDMKAVLKMVIRYGGVWGVTMEHLEAWQFPAKQAA